MMTFLTKLFTGFRLNPQKFSHSVYTLLSISTVLALLMGFATPMGARAATAVVTNLNDSGSGSLRQVIADAAPGDTITFSVSGTITLTTGELLVNKVLTLSGPGAGSLIISGNLAVPVLERVINNSAQLTISGLTIRSGTALSGGGILNTGDLTITNSVITDNRARGEGGGIFNSGTLQVTNSTISSNLTELFNATDASGAGIYNAGTGTATISNSTFYNNLVHDNGSAFFNAGTATIVNSTFSLNQMSGIATVYNDKHGGLQLNNVTMTVNTGKKISPGLFAAGGTVIVANSILADNHTAGSVKSSLPDCAGNITSGGHNLIGNTTGCDVSVGVGDLLGLGETPLNAKLGPLQNNGGLTSTHMLLAGSPAIDKGSPAVVGSGSGACEATDQRGVARPVLGLFGLTCDIGAVEIGVDIIPTVITISGNAKVEGVTLSYVNGTLQTVNSDVNGNYSITVPTGWNGTITPSKTGSVFTPRNRTYTNVTTNLAAQDYHLHWADTTGVFRPGNGALYLKNTNATGFADIQINYGTGGDYPVVGDWDGNGTKTIGIYRNGSFYLRNSNTIGFADLVFAFGAPGDQPVAGDWDGDGIDTIGVYRPSTGQFLLRNSNTSGLEDMSFFLGNVGDIGLAGDWNGDGKDTTGVFRPSNGVIFLKNTNTSGFADVALNYGLAGDQPVTGDWNGQGFDTIGVYRNGQFLLRNSNTPGFADIVFGLGSPGDMPIAGDWDGIP